MKNLLIKNTNFINKNLKFISNKDILIENGIIKKIGKISGQRTNIFDGRKFLLTSGFINAHFHLGETIFRGNANLKSLKHYLQYTASFTPYLKTTKSHNIISKISLIEAAKNGTSTISCSRGWDITQRSGIRGALGFPLMNSKKLKHFYENFENFFENKRKKFPILLESGNTQIKLDLWIHSLNKINIKLLELVSQKFSESTEINLTIHIAETKDQVKEIKKKFGKTEIQILSEYSLLNKRTNLVHVNHITSKDMELIAKHKANITICPISNILLNSGLPDLKKILKNKINVSIGTDGLATNNSASLLESAKITYLLFKDIISIDELFKMITINPAKTTGFDKCGIISTNHYADINFYDFTNSSLFPKENILKNLILNPTLLPKHVMVDGDFIIKDYKHTKINEKNALTDFKRLSKKIKNETPKKL